MNRFLTHKTAALAICCAALQPLRAEVVDGNQAVRVEARVQSRLERKDIKNASVDTVTQSKTLLIIISGKARLPENRTGQWVAYGRDLKGHELKVMESGEFKLDLATGPQLIESGKVSTTYTPEHATVSSSGRSRNRRTTVKKVEARGEKFAGYIVTVKDGDTIVGQRADPPGLAKELLK